MLEDAKSEEELLHVADRVLHDTLSRRRHLVDFWDVPNVVVERVQMVHFLIGRRCHRR